MHNSLWTDKCMYMAFSDKCLMFNRSSLSEPHTSGTALQDACVCMSVCDHIPKISIEQTDTEGCTTYISNLHTGCPGKSTWGIAGIAHKKTSQLWLGCQWLHVCGHLHPLDSPGRSSLPVLATEGQQHCGWRRQLEIQECQPWLSSSYVVSSSRDVFPWENQRNDRHDWKRMCWPCHATHPQKGVASLSEPHTSGTALQDACVCMYICMSACLLACGHIPKI